MTTVTPSDQAGAASAKRPATIPTQRSGQALRLLVLGSGEGAAAFRARAAEAGAELAQRFSVRVTHVVVEDGIGEGDARVVRARGAGLPVLGLDEGTALIEEPALGGDEAGLGEREADDGRADDQGAIAEATGAEAAVGAGAEATADPDTGADAGTGTGIGTDASASSGADARVGVGEEAGAAGSSRGHEDVDVDGVVPLIRPRAEVVLEAGDGGPSDVFMGSALEAMLQFPPLPVDEFESGDDGGVDGEAESAAAADLVAEAAQSALLDVVSAACARGETEAATTGGCGADVDGADGAMVRVTADLVTESAAVSAGGWASAAENAVGVAGDGAGVADRSVDLVADPVMTDVAASEVGRAAVGVGAAGGGRSAAWSGASVAWALVPLVSLGLLTPVAIGYAAYRLRSRRLVVATVCYSVAVVSAFAVSPFVPVHGTAYSVVGDLLTMCLAAAWLGGTAHSFLIRRSVFRLR